MFDLLRQYLNTENHHGTNKMQGLCCIEGDAYARLLCGAVNFVLPTRRSPADDVANRLLCSHSELTLSIYDLWSFVMRSALSSVETKSL